MNYLRIRLVGIGFSIGLSVLPAARIPAQVPAAIFTDPVHDSVNPARVVILHIPVAGKRINALAYVARVARRVSFRTSPTSSSGCSN